MCTPTCTFAALLRRHADPEPSPRSPPRLVQAAAPPSCFEYLAKSFGATAECFGSPLNCHFTTFCSAYADTDAVFGSRGSFFDFRPTSGCYEANPPFHEVCSPTWRVCAHPHPHPHNVELGAV